MMRGRSPADLFDSVPPIEGTIISQQTYQPPALGDLQATGCVRETSMTGLLSRIRRLERAARTLLALGLLLAALGSMPVQQPAQVKAHPALVSAAASKPEQSVQVIVQKANKNNAAENMVKSLGGKVTKDLSIINAFAAELTAGAALKLARSGDVKWVSPDADTVTTGSGSMFVDPNRLLQTFDKTIHATDMWNVSPTYFQGQGIGVAVVDSGVDSIQDLGNRLVTRVKFNSNTNNINDSYGHGTMMAGIIAGDGEASSERYVGVAPKANIVSVKVSDDEGGASTSDVVAGLQWVLENAATYNIRVVNLSMNSSLPESYLVNPICAAAEILWFNRIVVVVSAGNSGAGAILPPANDPFVITVGATDDRNTSSLSDDYVALFSAYGVADSGVTKPDVVAPGKDIISTMSSNDRLGREHPNNIVSNQYFRMSGTSVAAPMVSGAVALLLQDEPNLNPDQVKYRLKATANRNPLQWAYNSLSSGSGYLDVRAALQGNTTQTANTGTVASSLLWTGQGPMGWSSVNWSSVNWSSVNWSSVNWSSVNWSSVNWSSDHWGP
jgi:serine protease AprX